MLSPNFSPRKSLGQNFLIDKNIVRKIVDAAEVGRKDSVVEVGPGKGILTEQLLEKAGKVVAIEKDTHLHEFLSEHFAEQKHLELMHADALMIDTSILPTPYKLVANLPYSVATRILQHFLFSTHAPTLAVLMVQKEVGEKLVTIPPTATVLSNLIRNFGIIQLVHTVSPNCFRPRPKIDSVVIKITPHTHSLISQDRIHEFTQLLHHGFAQKRKRLVTTLAQGYKMDPKDVEVLFTKLDIPLMSRAQELPLQQWKELLDELPTLL